MAHGVMAMWYTPSEVFKGLVSIGNQEMLSSGGVGRGVAELQIFTCFDVVCLHAPLSTCCC